MTTTTIINIQLMFVLLLTLTAILPSFSYTTFLPQTNHQHRHYITQSQSTKLHSTVTKLTSPPPPSYLKVASKQRGNMHMEEILLLTERLPPSASTFINNIVLEGKEFVFNDVVNVIDHCYISHPRLFMNGNLTNTAVQNQGSGKLLSFAVFAKLNKANTLRLWAEHYNDVLNTPDGVDHGNIREFMKHGLKGVDFPEGLCLGKMEGSMLRPNIFGTDVSDDGEDEGDEVEEVE